MHQVHRLSWLHTSLWLATSHCSCSKPKRSKHHILVLVASFLWAHTSTQYKGLISGFLDHVLHTHTNRMPPTRFYKSLSTYPVSFQVLWPISAPKPSCFQRPGEQMSLDPIRYFPFPHHALRTPPFPMFANTSPLSSHQYFLSSLWSYLLFKSTARPNKV